MDPQSLTYRSPVYAQLREFGAEFAEINGYAVAMSIGEAGTQAEALRHLALCDLSGLARTGVKGGGIGSWLAQKSLTVPPAANRAIRQADGSLLAMLADNEGLVLGDIDHAAGTVERVAAAFEDEAQPGLLVPRQHGQAWFRLSGTELAPMLAKLCAVDLRPAAFDDLQVAQTSVARLNSIVIRDDLAGIPAVHLLVDSASAAYLWACLLDAGAEAGLSVVGLAALRNLDRS